jgi:phosphoethanolamine N-methyltransferase
MSNLLAKEYFTYHKSDVVTSLAKLAHGTDYCGQSSSATFSEIKEQLDFYNINHASKLLDLGCGDGSLSLKIAENYNCHVSGVDISERLIVSARDKADKLNLIDNTMFSTSDFSKLLDVSSMKFDVLLSIGSLYWCANLEKILKLWKDKLEETGKLIIFLNMKYIELTNDEVRSVEGTSFIDEKDMFQILNDIGFGILKISDNTATYVEWLNRWISGMEMLSSEMCEELGKEKAEKISSRFKTYLKLALSGKVKRIILVASKTQDIKL